MNEPEWLSVNIMLDVHAEQLALFGGPDGIRDPGMLESALARPINKFAYGKPILLRWPPPTRSALPRTIRSLTATRGQRLLRSSFFSG